MKLRLLLVLILFPTPLLRPADDAVNIDSIVTDITTHNPELRFYEDELAAAKADLRGAGAFNNPALAIQAGRKRSRDLSGVLAGEGTAWSVTLNQTFEWPGRVALRKAIANRQVELAELGVARFRSALAARARTLAYGLYATAEKSAATREVADRFAALRETFLARDPAGITPLLDTRVIEARELALQRRATAASLAAQGGLAELNQLRGVPALSPLRTTAGRMLFHPAPPLDELLAAAREKNFEFRMKKVELEQQGFVVSLARNERYPAFTVSPYYSRENADSRDTTVGIGLSVPLPISARGRSGIEAAEAKRRQAETAVLLAQRDMEREVIVSAHAFMAKLDETSRWSPDSAQKFRDAAELADRHYRLGAVPLATYIELQNAYLEAVEALLDTKREALEAGLKLQQLTGVDFNAVEIAP
jgi:cobalt-zinc-cadmium efflux system outer membrane protein